MNIFVLREEEDPEPPEQEQGQEEEEELTPEIEIPVLVSVSIPLYIAPDYIQEQRSREAAEIMNMTDNDIRYASFYIEDVKSEESEEEADSSIATEEEHAPEAAVDSGPSAAQKISNLRAKLNDVARGYHPRRSDSDFDGGAFFPMMFSNDLVFYPFNSQIQVGADRAVNTPGSSNEVVGREPLLGRLSSADCSDIQQVIIDRKSQLEKDRLTQLYRTSLADVASELWTPIVRKEGVDWEAFMELEMVERLRPQTVEISSKEDEGDAIMSEQFFTNRLKYAKEGTFDPISTIRLGDKEDGGPSSSSPTPKPLAFGKMHGGLCEINRPEYFYVRFSTIYTLKSEMMAYAYTMLSSLYLI